MADKRKIKLKSLENKMQVIQERNGVDLNDLQLLKDITKFNELKKEAFFLKFEIEHCEMCSQLLPEYKNNKKWYIQTN